MRIITLFLTVFFFFPSMVSSQDMDNPYILEDEWTGYSIGDPYVLKHRGVFYLYCSTKDSETGIKTWSSTDLISWTYEGLTSTDPVTKGAYAPEVFYKNGTFYMYTSPAGNGHYVLSAPSPTGPFVPVTGNLGRSIDGSVFSDDDGSWYFYHASPGGIIGCPMDDPLTIGAGNNTGVVINNAWTEGPCVFKRNGLYYMIYTGNHVISKGYRIDYGISEEGPITSFQAAENQNPILLRSLGLHTGLGHGSIFIGPDLDTYFLTYHNLVSRNGPYRRLNFDRIAWNDEKMLVLGPTDYAQQNPALPDAYDFLARNEPGEGWDFPSGGDWKMNNGEELLQDAPGTGDGAIFLALLDSVSDDNYTAEYNLRELERTNAGAAMGVVFGYSGPTNYGLAMVNSTTNTLEVNFLNDNSWGTPVTADLSAGLDLSQWHAFRIEKMNDRFRFYLDNMLQLELTHEMPGGKIGYATTDARAVFSFIAFSNQVNGSGTFDVYKPIPGKLSAIQYNTGGEGIGFHKGSGIGNEPGFIRTDEVEWVRHEHGGVALASLTSGDWFRYNMNVEVAKLYNAQMIYRTASDDARIKFYLDGEETGDAMDLPSSQGEWKTWLFKDIELPEGYHTLTVEVESGTVDLYGYEFVVANNYSFDEQVPFDGSFGAGWKYDDGEWLVNGEYASIDGYGKRTFGSTAWRDYTVDADILFTRSMNAGIIFRVNNPAIGGAGDDPALGTDYLQGYFCGFNFGTVVLGKHNYGWEKLETASMSLDMNTWYHLRAVVNEDRIRIFVDDMTEPVIDYTDQYPFINGMAGLRSFNTGVQYDNFRVRSELITTAVVPVTPQGINGGMNVYPNPTTGMINIAFENETLRSVSLLDLKGAELRSFVTEEALTIINTGELETGMYILCVEDRESVTTTRLLLNKKQ